MLLYEIVCLRVNVSVGWVAAPRLVIANDDMPSELLSESNQCQY